MGFDLFFNGRLKSPLPKLLLYAYGTDGTVITAKAPSPRILLHIMGRFLQILLLFQRGDVYLVFSYPVPEAAFLDAEQLCRPYLFALGPHEGHEYHPLFKPLQLIVDR